MTTAPCCCADWVGGLARDHARSMAAIARAEGLDAVDALDAVQEAFHTLLGRPDVDELKASREDAANVLAVVVRNAARNMRRRHHRARPHVGMDEVDLADGAPGPDAALELATTTTKLAGCMARLGDVHRHVIALRVLEEMSGDDAARALGVTPNHVGVLLHRARKELARCMAG